MTTNNIINDKDIYYDLSPLDIELVERSKKDECGNIKILPEYIYTIPLDGKPYKTFKLQKELLCMIRKTEDSSEISSKDYLYQFYSSYLASLSCQSNDEQLPYASCDGEHNILFVPEFCINRALSIFVNNKMFAPFVKIKNQDGDYEFAYIVSDIDNIEFKSQEYTDLCSQILDIFEVKSINI